jgi:hypothetical protein
MKKRGQFYLAAAIVIIVLIVGFATVQNFTKRQSSIKLYDVREELGIEGGKVLDYGTYNVDNEADKKDLIEYFTSNYTEYAGEGRNLYFIFGNPSKIYVISYEEVVSGTLSVSFGEGGRSQLETFIKEGEVTEYDPKGDDTVIIKIGDLEYEFELKRGENFYFIVSQEIGGEQHVVIS